MLDDQNAAAAFDQTLEGRQQLAMSSKCRPVVGSSKINSVPSQVASARCAASSKGYSHNRRVQPAFCHTRFEEYPRTLQLRSVNRLTTSEVDCSFAISRLYHSSPKSMPSVPFDHSSADALQQLAEGFSKLCVRESSLMNTSGHALAEDNTSASDDAFGVSA